MTAPSSQAIQAALKSNWKDAIKINKEILSDNPENVDALSRLAYAYSKIGDFDTAIETYQTILTLDHYNPIATKNLGKIKQLKAKNTSPVQNDTSAIQETDDCPPISPSLFIADAQKTKNVKLVNIAQRQALAHVCIGEEVQAVKRRFELQVKDSNGVYIGSFPDDVGHTFMRRIADEKPFKMYVKDIQDNAVTVFIKY